MKRLLELGLLGMLGVQTAWACLPDREEILDLQVIEVQIDGVAQRDLDPWSAPARIQALDVEDPRAVDLHLDGEGFVFVAVEDDAPMGRLP